MAPPTGHGRHPLLLLVSLFFWALIPVPASAGSVALVKNAALSTISPYATQIGLSVLQREGSAMDAAVAVSFALAVAHPQAGNLGGGGYLVYYEASSGGVWTLDFASTAPLASRAEMFRAPPSVSAAALRAGTPGTVAGLAEAHRRFGHLKWADLLTPSVRLAREGVRVSTELAADLLEAKESRQIDAFPSTAAIYFPGGVASAAASLLVQTDLADSLERIGRIGPAEFYKGAVGRKLIATMRKSGGIVTERDLREYRPIWRAPFRVEFGKYSILTLVPPSAGGMLIGQTLAILSGFDLLQSGFQTAQSIHLIAEAERRAHIDSQRYMGDPAYTRIPYRELLSSDRAEQWRRSILPDRATPTGALGIPGRGESPNTTHVSIVDSKGNIAALTTSLNANFGNGQIVDGAGFFLNNAMDEFLTDPALAGGASGKGVQPGGRSVSSLAPAIVFRSGKPFLAIGSPGGAMIPTTILQILLNLTVYEMTLPQSVAAARFHHQAVPDQIYYERDRAPKELLTRLNEMGHGVVELRSIGDVHAVQIDETGLTAVADPRHGGSAGGY
ncbi:MAG TPA: gamma-glutamyltransferase [Thermoanaerobaculia bacterium]|nr:gamma-glutamyltransferase [Thermoanaerobaculia bacterium]